MLKTAFIPLSESKINKSYKIFRVKTDNDITLRRILDLGMVRGAEIKALHKSPTGNLTAYFIKGAVIALRDSDAKNILVYQAT
ncbi:MAG: ferrous iron transport protein A [Clostridia bacterium]|nr:ferrous iron transport protein A [Clostridia bacterium]